MKNNFLRIPLFLLFVLAVACSDDDVKSKGKFEHGIFVVNEGNFKSSDGTISFYDPETTTVVPDIFGAANNGLALGDVVQSMSVHNDQAFIVVNNDNKVEVVDANTFTSSYTLSDVKLPRYFTTFNNKGYLTEWVSFTDPGRVAVVDLDSHTISTRITVDYGAENIIEKGGKLYVSNNFSTTVSVIDPAKNEVTKTIEVGSSPGEFVIDKNDALWVVCGGGYQANDGSLVQINSTTNEVSKTIPLARNVSVKIAYNKSDDKIYYFTGTSVYEVTTTATVGPTTALIEEKTATGFYGIGFDNDKGVLYVGDAKAFVGNGKVYRYKTNGSSVDTFDSGRGPGNFLFK